MSRILDPPNRGGWPVIRGHLLEWKIVTKSSSVNQLLDSFEGRLTSGKYAKLTRCSPDTALRDLAGLVDLGALRRSQAGGRSTSCELV